MLDQAPNPFNPDVLVIGAGAAGIAAAVGARRSGASVSVLEKYTMPGGCATAAYVATVCGLYFRSNADAPRFAHNGFPCEFAERLGRHANLAAVKFKNGLWFLPYNHASFLNLCDELMMESGANVYLGSQAIDCSLENNRLVKVSASVFNHKHDFYPSAVIDTSGQGLFSQLAGLSSIVDDTYQASAQVFQIGGLPAIGEQELSLALMRALKTGVDEGGLSVDLSGSHIIPGTYNRSSVSVKIPLKHDTNESDRTDNILDARRQVFKLFEFLCQHAETFRNARLEFIAPESGIRTGPRNLGKHVLTSQEVLSCARFDDAIARGTWPIEFWPPGGRLQMEYFAEESYYEIPARSLKSKAVGNLFFAGRNISADEKAIASSRVIGTCLATGYSAGVMAAHFSKGSNESTAISRIKEQLFDTPR